VDIKLDSEYGPYPHVDPIHFGKIEQGLIYSRVYRNESLEIIFRKGRRTEMMMTGERGRAICQDSSLTTHPEESRRKYPSSALLNQLLSILLSFSQEMKMERRK